MGKIVVVGLSGESIFLNVDHFNKSGETVVSKTFHTEPGGKGYNQALALRKLDANVTFITVIGDDIYGKSTIDGLNQFKVNNYIIKKPASTAVAVIVTDKKGENNVTVYRGVNDIVETKDIVECLEKIDDIEYLLLQQEMPKNVTYEIIKYGYNRGVKVILNPAPAYELDKEIIKYLYLITPNEYEAKVIFNLSDKNNLDDIITEAKKNQVSRMVVTLGSKGAAVYEFGNLVMVDSIRVKAVDTTGAGDMFNAGLVNELASGRTLVEAAKYANVAAGLSVTKKGVIAGLPTNKEVREYMKNE